MNVRGDHTRAVEYAESALVRQTIAALHSRDMCSFVFPLLLTPYCGCCALLQRIDPDLVEALANMGIAILQRALSSSPDPNRMARESAAEVGRAVSTFEQALYVRPAHWQAAEGAAVGLIHLALRYRTQSAASAAAKQVQREFPGADALGTYADGSMYDDVMLLSLAKEHLIAALPWATSETVESSGPGGAPIDLLKVHEFVQSLVANHTEAHEHMRYIKMAIYTSCCGSRTFVTRRKRLSWWRRYR